MDKLWTPKGIKSTASMYVGIANALEQDIASGDLAIGERLPTHRELADHLNVAIGTVTRAYLEAEKRGLIEGKGRSGTYVRAFNKAKSELSKQIASRSCDDFESYLLPYGIPVPDFNTTLMRICARPKKNKYKYWPPESNRDEHYETGATWLKKSKVSVSADEIVISSGNHHGILAALAANVNSGDMIATEAHTYIGMKTIADFLKLKLVGLETDHEGIKPEAFESACRQKHIKALHCTPNMQNPTNGVMSEQRRKAIALIADRYGVVILEDDVTRAVMAEPPVTFQELLPELAYVIVSPSKIITPGLRLGYIVPPVRRKQRLLDMLRATHSYPGGLPSVIFRQMIVDGIADNVICSCQREAAIRQEIIKKLLPHKLVRCNPESYYAWIRLPNSWSPHHLIDALGNLPLYPIPAPSFAVNPADTTRAIRIGIGVAPNQAVFTESVRQLAYLLSSTP